MRARELSDVWLYVPLGNKNDCWEWTGCYQSRKRNGITQKRYGKFRSHNVYYLAHGLIWELTKGPIPEDLFVCHSCDNPPCVNPDHLFLGTALDNELDMVKKGRHQHGDNHWTRRRPDLLPRGEDHHARLHPENLARGDKHGMRIKARAYNTIAGS